MMDSHFQQFEQLSDLSGDRGAAIRNCFLCYVIPNEARFAPVSSRVHN